MARKEPDPEVIERMNELAQLIGGAMPNDNIGFVLLMFDKGPDGWMNYISSCERDGMIESMEELLTNLRKDGH